MEFYKIFFTIYKIETTYYQRNRSDFKQSKNYYENNRELLRERESKK